MPHLMKYVPFVAQKYILINIFVLYAKIVYYVKIAKKKMISRYKM